MIYGTFVSNAMTSYDCEEYFIALENGYLSIICLSQYLFLKNNFIPLTKAIY